MYSFQDLLIRFYGSIGQDNWRLLRLDFFFIYKLCLLNKYFLYFTANVKKHEND